MKKDFKFSIIIPVYNEERAIKSVLRELKDYLKEKSYQAEIIVVNDGSTDQTKKILKKTKGIRLINHPYNKGYGAAIKTGLQAAQYNLLLFYDSDGQHQPKYIEKLIKYIGQYDMVIGARQGGYQGSLGRRLSRKLLQWLAAYLVKQSILDLNSGLRIVKKNSLLKILHLLPNSFSLTTTLTLTFFKQGLNVKYVPIRMRERIGQSTVKIKDGFNVLVLMTKTILLFSPLRIFLPISGLLILGAMGVMIYDFIQRGFKDPHDLTILLLTFSGLILFFFGFLADQIATLRREIK